MATDTKPTNAVDSGIEELRDEIDRYLNGTRDHEGRTRIAEQMDRIRESLPHDNTAVGLIHELRGPLHDLEGITDESPTNGLDDSEIRERIEAALDRARRGIHDPKLMREAAERMDRERNELRE